METTPQIDSHLKANMNMSKKDIIVGNFLGGIAWGFGTVIGAGVVVAILGAILNQLGVFNTIGSFFSLPPQLQ
ncbi:MAG: hypothetical protein HYW45_03795 [Candidatus Daviesbacteria bacterium]|nr:MAG: hypothetical protein HYW45_03795 [Candidatus Daviesbacteria bacterium]